jgi:hypothetical protein
LLRRDLEVTGGPVDEGAYFLFVEHRCQTLPSNSCSASLS